MNSSFNEERSCCLQLLNLDNEDIVGYPILHIFGRVTCYKCCRCDVSVKSLDRLDSLASKWPTDHHLFKIFVELLPGINRLLLSHMHANAGFMTLKIHYKPMQKERFVRPVYIICGNSSGTYDAPPNVDNSQESAMEKIAFNASLLQTFVAENMRQHGFGRETFRIERKVNGKVKVNTFRSKLSVEEARKMNGNELYSNFYEELNASHLADLNCKFWTFMSCTKYCAPPEEEFNEKKITEYVKAHTALGGGNMALFGTAGLHTWASGIDEIVAKFTDERCIDKLTQFDDSCSRGTYWANYATTLGAAMHELGHCFDLPHTKGGIMGRGFDDMHLFFLPHKIEGTDGNEYSLSAYMDGGAHWHRSSAVSLSLNSWIGGANTEEIPSGSPILSTKRDMYGPIGAAPDDAAFSEQVFHLSEWLECHELAFGGFVFYAAEYLEAFRAIGYKYSNKQEVTYMSPIIGSIEGKQLRKFPFLLTEESERIVRMKIRAGCWIDGIQVFSNYKSSVWCGGTGGNMYNFEFSKEVYFTGLIAAAGAHVGSIGVQVKRVVTDNHPINLHKPVAITEDDIVGPVGSDAGNTRFPETLDVQSWLNSKGLTFGGLVFYADEYINAIQGIGQKIGDDNVPILTKLSPLIGRTEGKKMKKIRFVITEKDEHIVKIKIRAGCWVDGIQLFTNKKSSLWYGGGGGNLYQFDFDDAQVFSGFIATAGKHVGSLGFQIKRNKPLDETDKQPFYFVDSPSGIRLVEARDEGGDVYLYKEYNSCSRLVLPRDFIHKGNKNCVVRIINESGECTAHHLTLPC